MPRQTPSVACLACANTIVGAIPAAVMVVVVVAIDANAKHLFRRASQDMQGGSTCDIQLELLEQLLLENWIIVQHGCEPNEADPPVLIEL